MDQSSTPRTARDALTIELIGDIGRLDDQIKALPHTMNEALAPTLGALVMASNEAQKTITQLGAEEKKSLQKFSASEQYSLREALKQILREEAGKAVARAANELETSAQTHREAIKRESNRQWKWLSIACVIGLGAGAVGSYISHQVYFKPTADQRSYIAYGKALNLIWGNLNAKTKKQIQDAVKPE